jgi:predicted HicB family RNase H-like nuclease
VAVRLNVAIDDDLHRAAKAEAALAGLSLARFVEEAILEAVAAAERGRRGKGGSKLSH